LLPPLSRLQSDDPVDSVDDLLSPCGGEPHMGRRRRQLRVVYKFK
jgi:hypothetical protein